MRTFAKGIKLDHRKDHGTRRPDMFETAAEYEARKDREQIAYANALRTAEAKRRGA